MLHARFAGLTILFLLFFANYSEAQMMMSQPERQDTSGSGMQTLLNSKTNTGLFCGPVIKFGQINNHLAAIMGGRGALLINHQISFGVAGYGLMGQTMMDEISPDTTRYLHLMYGGLEIGYIFQPEKLINFSTTLLVGGGRAIWQDQNRYGYSMHESNNRGSSFFALEPSVLAGLNITTHWRVTAGVSYLFVNGLAETWIRDNDVRGFMGSVGVLFGKF